MEHHPVSIQNTKTPLSLPSTHTLRRKVHRLGITHKEFHALRTIGDLQRLVKMRYRQLAKAYHPDTRRTGHHPTYPTTPPLPGEPQKRCPQCGIIKHADAFAFCSARRGNGLQGYCKSCNYLLQKSPSTQPRLQKGIFFQYLTEAYKYVMALPSHEILHRRPRGSYTLTGARAEPLPEHEATLPFSMERPPLTLSFGWQQTYL